MPAPVPKKLSRRRPRAASVEVKKVRIPDRQGGHFLVGVDVTDRAAVGPAVGTVSKLGDQLVEQCVSVSAPETDPGG